MQKKLMTLVFFTLSLLSCRAQKYAAANGLTSEAADNSRVPAFIEFSVQPGPDDPTTGSHSAEKVFGIEGCSAQTAAGVVKCLKIALRTNGISASLKKKGIKVDKLDFCLETEGPVPGDMVAYRFEQMENGVCVSDSIVSAFVDNSDLKIISVKFKISSLAGAPQVSVVNRDQSVAAAISKAKNVAPRRTEGHDFFSPPESISGRPNPRPAYVYQNEKWHLAEDIELSAKIFCAPESIDPRKCLRYRVFVDLSTGKVLQITPLNEMSINGN
jgi:hypothetical protein